MLMHAVAMGEQADASRPVFVPAHGLGMSSCDMQPTGRLLAGWGEVYAPDLPRFGKSGKPSRSLTIPELADSLTEGLATKFIERGGGPGG